MNGATMWTVSGFWVTSEIFWFELSHRKIFRIIFFKSYKLRRGERKPIVSTHINWLVMKSGRKRCSSEWGCLAKSSPKIMMFLFEIKFVFIFIFIFIFVLFSKHRHWTVVWWKTKSLLPQRRWHYSNNKEDIRFQSGAFCDRARSQLLPSNKTRSAAHRKLYRTYFP